MSTTYTTKTKTKWLKLFFFAALIKILIGLRIYNREHLPDNGPAIVVANHNSHLDAIVLMSLYPLKKLSMVRPVAAADYFLRNRFLSWFSTHVLDIVPLSRNNTQNKEDLLHPCHQALINGQILILFPEGTRGEPEQRQPLKKGIYYLSQAHTECTVTPVFIYGLGKSLPKGEKIIVPFFSDIVIGQSIPAASNASDYIVNLQASFDQLSSKIKTDRYII
ncbi:lysophospholipid acyltransferase family protein [Zooshikella harenae]|uniref:1-acyl-sn-glycerol-3-phosphate acyltransferase n=1 Tax=Zooshikella harenae TaxID=2827238 RepID=A0ABS5ZDF4_9GAMM|nr:lysophospholipid acyltransferase family protein [Zooshikella harenae]MBU2711300.1 1-acyl-sn-glycerol-3-phosphate acyltransferase [Zooshikella harenae]